MKILLDIDGVMVLAKPWESPNLLGDGFPAFDIKSIKALSEIINLTKANIVLTTSHKSKFSAQEWIDIFMVRGIKLDIIDRLEKNSMHLNRKDEILNWYNQNKQADSFVIIDDDKSLNDLPSVLKNRLVLTSPLIGLTKSLAQEAIDILNSKNSICI